MKYKDEGNETKYFKGGKMKYKHQGFHQVWYQGGVKATVSGVVEDLKFKRAIFQTFW